MLPVDLPPELRALLDKLEHPERALLMVSDSLAEEAIGLIHDGFRDERDPYGHPWQKRKRETKTTRGKKVLSGETGRLKTGWKARRVGVGGFLVSPSVDYAMPHQKPLNERRPRRAMVPDDEIGGLPGSWSARYDEAAQDALSDYFGRR